MNKLKCVLMYFGFQCLCNCSPMLTTPTDRNISCALNGIHIRNIYKQRRQGALTLANALFPNQGPTKGVKYNPTIGYEAYWPEGDWVYSKAPNRTTLGIKDEMCGRPCSKLYREYGPICGRNKKFVHKTFNTYCELHNEDCLLREVQYLVVLLLCISSESQMHKDWPPHLQKQYMEEIQNAYKDYNPNPGYEPYWADGAWVFVDRDAKFNRSTTKMQLVCGEECNYLHKRIKDVCGRQVYSGDSQCHSPHCIIDDFTSVFTNFNTYCEFLNQQCRETKLGKMWVLVHAGRCVAHSSLLPPVRYGGLIVSRVNEYFTKLSQVFFNNSLPPPV